MATETEPKIKSRLVEIDRRIEAAPDLGSKKALRAERARIEREGYAALGAFERVRLARHPDRPQTLDYIDRLISGFIEVHGDRRFADDGAIVAGFGTFGQTPVAIVGHQRGRSTDERIRRNFGKPHPEGYRKAGRIYQLASRFNLPLITFIDTQGAEPGVGAEERGQAEAIARDLELMARLEAPVIASVIGEGGSGGALALGVANVVLIQEYACYSVITPEGCAAILWRGEGPEKVADAAAALKLSAPDLKRLGIVDEIVAEPIGGAHRDPAGAAENLVTAIRKHLDRLLKLPPEQWRRARERKFRSMGVKFLSRESEGRGRALKIGGR
jgi:acetyl-CoA carboxylase carboxyl transferase subunit alpha